MNADKRTHAKRYEQAGWTRLSDADQARTMLGKRDVVAVYWWTERNLREDYRRDSYSLASASGPAADDHGAAWQGWKTCRQMLADETCRPVCTTFYAAPQ
jgi:hypothetical protein